MPHDHLPIQNAILQRLPAGDLKRLGSLERVKLELRQALEAANTSNEFVYFIEDGVASTVWENSVAGATEIGLIGVEGMTGLGILYGDTQSPFETFMQVEGAAMRCESRKLAELWDTSPTLRNAVARYARSFSIQVSATAVINGRYNLEQRLARWLLMVSDRAGGKFNITHEFIAVMLAVTRPGVTLAVQSLEGLRLIRASRGTVEIVDRVGLQALAKDAYGLPEREYARLWSLA
jgi:CRP-like cAMP-binding protein